MKPFINLYTQRKHYQFYLQYRLNEYCFLYSLFEVHCKGGVYSGHTSREIYTAKGDLGGWQEIKCYGLYVDLTFLCLRIGIYLHPIIIDTKPPKV